MARKRRRNPWSGNPRRHSKAAKLGWRRRKRRAGKKVRRARRRGRKARRKLRKSRKARRRGRKARRKARIRRLRKSKRGRPRRRGRPRLSARRRKSRRCPKVRGRGRAGFRSAAACVARGKGKTIASKKVYNRALRALRRYKKGRSLVRRKKLTLAKV